MGFQKGHKLATGRPKGSKDVKTLQWNNIGDFLVNEGSAKFLIHLQTLAEKDPEKYTDAFMKILEYFKPKLARQEQILEGEVKLTGFEVNIKKID